MGVDVGGRNVDYFGEVVFESEIPSTCRINAKEFLSRMLCDGIQISHTHYWLVKSFYDVVNELVEFVEQSEPGVVKRELSGNQDGTAILVAIES